MIACARSLGNGMRNLCRRFMIDCGGNIAMTFAIVSVPLLIAMGMAVDYTRAYNVQAKMGGDLDAALLAAIKQVGTGDEDDIKALVGEWFAAQTELGSGYTLNDDDIVIDTSGHTITAKVSAPVETSFLKIAGINTITVAVLTSVTGTSTDYVNVYIVLDKSASMLLAATTGGQASLISKTAFSSKSDSSEGCVFACHTSIHSGRSSNYQIAVANGITLRTDVQLNAVKKVLELVATANSTKNHVKVGYYTLGTSTTGNSLVNSSYETVNGIHTVQSPIYSNSTLTELLTTSSELSSATAYSSSDFRALKDLATIVGSNGDGSSESSPLKIVMLITDGAQSSMGWVGTGSSAKYITPMNPAWCDNIKNNDATMAVLYTEYLAVADGDDVANYKASIGGKMNTSYFNSVWSGASSYLTSDVRRDKIATVLSACASGSQYFIAADSTAEITTGFSSLLTTYLSAVRLTE